ncbi:hypothetical protein EII34_14360 [Arachnia propionica]|uniref:Uncharacterized protein n=1 Tax=Arachnia propionica TaxID=1750 RepID=A0A3P1T1Q0_9ACTN|nr:hypothetical protein [Arachnia propionica]RRD03371.1 hypothetical protein EII34_14360 [Arachnia propionica]
MTPRPWSLIDPDTRVADIAPCALVAFTDEQRHLLLLYQDSGGEHRWEDLEAPSWRKSDSDRIDGTRRVEALGQLFRWRAPQPVRFLLVPGFSVPTWPRGLVVGLAVLLAVVTTVVTLATDNITLFGVGGMVTLLVPMLIASGFTRVEILGRQPRGVTQQTVHAYALAVERGEPWQGELPAGAVPSPTVLVERVQQQYAELRTDLVYRLENPALFDPAVPTTAAFETALVDFADAPSLETAARVEVRFRTARQYAEKLGMRHVAPGQRTEVSRAVKIARLAADASSTGERRAALQQLQRILEPLALYYLPGRVDLPAIEDR